ncbi:MAG: thiamine pyrophosphate-binding protein [Candidatus Omnitrophica bacterium]|nr:thiamine pyrophosphate-binding protein [Candidatus Omnitrophota bacterium]
MIKLSDYIVKFLEKNAVKHIFMLTGGGCMHLVNSVGDSKKIKYICCHHEQTCAMAAEAYAKFKNDFGVVLVTSGPGGTNTITGLAGAYQDSAPCIFISGQSKRKQTVQNSRIKLRQFGVQEVDIIPIVESITKYAIMVNDPKKIKYHLEKALYLAKSGRPGPVWLDIPLDVQSSLIDENELVGFYAGELNEDFKTEPSQDEVSRIINYLKTAQRPVIIAGRGIRIAGAAKELVSFANKYKIPVVTPIMGIDVISSDNRSYIGRVGTKGTRAGNFAMQNADLILSIGSRLSVSVVGHEYKLFAREAKVVVVDIDTVEHRKKTINIFDFINADAKKFLEKLATALKNEKLSFSDNWLNKCNEWKHKYPVCLEEYKKNKGAINFYNFMEELNKRLTADIPVISDAGSAFYVVAQSIHIKNRQRYITSGALATMGFGLPAAIGIAVLAKNTPVVTITGDGSFQQNIQELQTIVHNNFPIKIFVINNKGYLSIRQTQKRFFNGNLVGEGETSGISFPDTKKIAAAYNIRFVKAENNEKLAKVLDEVFSHEGPVLCEICALEEQMIIPTNSAAIRADGSMVSKPLEDMFPFLTREEFLSNMIVAPCEE